MKQSSLPPKLQGKDKQSEGYPKRILKGLEDKTLQQDHREQTRNLKRISWLYDKHIRSMTFQ